MGATWGLPVVLGHKGASFCTSPQKNNGGFLEVSWGLPINTMLTTWGLPLPNKTMGASWKLPKQSHGGYLSKLWIMTGATFVK